MLPVIFGHELANVRIVVCFELLFSPTPITGCLVWRESVNETVLVTVHANTNHLLIGVEKASRSGKESAPPPEAVFKWADSVTVRGYPVNSNPF